MFIRILAGTYLIYLFVANFINQLSDNNQNEENEVKDNNRFFKIVALLSITDLAFSIDSITTAVAISDQYILVIIGAIIGVIALRFTSGVFLRLLDYFLNLEMAGYIAILIIGIKLILNTIFNEVFLSDYYFYVFILIAFIWGFSKRKN